MAKALSEKKSSRKKKPALAKNKEQQRKWRLQIDPEHDYEAVDAFLIRSA
jgi:hypothetical protein